MSKSLLKERRKMLFLPINKAHALVETVFIIQFGSQLPADAINRLRDGFHFFKDLPSREDVITFVAGFQNSPDGLKNFSDSPKIVGREAKRVKADGSLEWVVKTDSSTITVHCLDYTRWDKVKSRSLGYMDLLLKNISSFDPLVAAVGLKNIDRFIFDGEHAEFDNSDLFNADSELIFRKAFENHERWHNHVGWFQGLSQDKGFECLNQLNIDAAFSSYNGERRHLTSIDHNALARVIPSAWSSENGCRLSDMLKPVSSNCNAPRRLERLYETLHAMNKRVLSQLLNEKMAKRIKLEVGDAP